MDKSIKICQIGPYKPAVGGPSTHIQAIVDKLKNNSEVSIISIEVKGHPLRKIWNDNGIKVYQEGIPFSFISSLVQVLIKTTKRAVTIQRNFDIFHAHGFIFSGIGFLNKSIPLVLTVHGYGSLESVFNKTIAANSFKYKVLRRLEIEAVKRSDVIIAVGSKLKLWIIDDLGANPEKVVVIPNGVDINDFKFNSKSNIEIRKRHNIDLNTPILLFTKHFSPRYGAQYLVPALELIKKEYPTIKLIMTNDDKWKQTIIDIAKKYNVDSNILFTGRVPYSDLTKYYSACDVFVHPSINDQETFGISLVEAMACSKPVVATAVGGPKEIIDGGNNVGILVQPENSKEIACAVLNLLHNTSKAEEIGLNARLYVESKYTWDKVTEEIYSVYESAIAKKAKN